MGTLCTDAVITRGALCGRIGRTLACLSVLGAANMGWAQTLEARVQAAIDKAKLGGGRVGVSVVDAQSGRELVGIERGRDGGFIPASNLKLLTSGAALLVLGPEYEFRTSIILNNDKLLVRGAGDPALADPELLRKMHVTIDAFVDRLVDSVEKASPASIREIVIDDRVFDREYVHPDWPAEQLNRAYCAQVCGVNFHANVLNVFVGPGSGQGDVKARVEPAGSWITLRRLARTVKEGSTEVWLERDKEPYAFRLHGTVRSAPDAPIQVTVNEPSVMFGRVLADRLFTRKVGVGAQTAPANVRLATSDESLDDTGTVATVVRTPLSVVLERCNVDSDNLYAESLLKAAGHASTGQPGSWSNGSAVVRMKVQEALGAEMAAKLIMSDGSGLSRVNRVTPELLARWLAAMSKSKGGDTYVRSLAVAGEEGTLKRRFKGSKLKNEVRAKSGYIRGVRTLSGYVTDPDSGRQMTFSVLVDEVPAGADQRAKELHEDVVEIVDNYLAQQTGRTQATPKKTSAAGTSKRRSGTSTAQK